MSQEIIDSRDLIKELDELNEELDELHVETDDRMPDEDERERIAEIEEKIAEIESIEGCCEDWLYGATLIHEDYFEDYARQLADDIGAIDRNANWPLDHIDWESAARDLATDYTTVEFDGETYYVR